MVALRQVLAGIRTCTPEQYRSMTIYSYLTS